MSGDSVEHEIEVTETSPLLADDRPKSSSKVSSDEVDHGDIPKYRRFASAVAKHWSQWEIVYLTGVFIIIINVASNIGAPAQLRMLEAAICRRFYAQEDPSVMDMEEDIPEEYCKPDPIQAELALVLAWNAVFVNVVGLLTSIPWGVVADRKGRRFVVLIGVFGIGLCDVWYYIVCYYHDILPPRVVWAGALFYAIGGGATVLTSVLLAMVADASPPDTRATVLFLLSAAGLGAGFIGPTLGIAALKRFSYWPPAGLSLAILVISMIPLAFLPTTAIKGDRHVAGGQEEREEVEGDRANGRFPSEQPMERWYTRLASSVMFGISELTKVFDLILSNPTLRVGIVICGLSKVSTVTLTMLPQFVSKRFGRSIGDASYVLVVKGATSLTMLLVVLPGITKLYRTKYRISGPPLDLRTVYVSGPFLVLGSLFLGFANSSTLLFLSLVVWDLGIGYRAALDSFLASTVLPSQMATLFVAMSAIDTIGILGFSPLLAWTFSKGMHLGGAWIGMPFFVGALALTVAVVLGPFLKPRGPSISDVEDETHET